MESHGTRANYIVGFVLAVVLTAIPFALVATQSLSRTQTVLVIAAAAVLQILVHLRFFLHMSFSRSARENLLAVAFTAVLVFLMVGGSIWVMLDLHTRMAL
ncbi:cytochrome o ubiquinol oxidase subunit IV [Reyranella sp.]|uniref:cytochrome o ubiquinol oxidase subunit IV n=1 Tax=Reyranella sp. TaxID=1929291 RepID=UPI00378312B3